MLKAMAVAVAVAVLGFGCAHHTFGTPLQFGTTSTDNSECAKALLQTSRNMGYVELATDLDAGFLRVRARTTQAGINYDPQFASRPMDIKRQKKFGMVTFNVQCTERSVSVTAVGVEGPFNDEMPMNAKLRAEFDAFGAGLRAAPVKHGVRGAAPQRSATIETNPEAPPPAPPAAAPVGSTP
jgi:hypothetical protein